MPAGARGKQGRFVKKNEAQRRRTLSECAKKFNEVVQEKKKQRQQEAKEPVYYMGNRVMNPGLLAKTMWCDECDVPLSFRGLEKEVQRGLASIFYIRCHNCLLLKTINSGTKMQSTDGYALYSINCKAAAG